MRLILKSCRVGGDGVGVSLALVNVTEFDHIHCSHASHDKCHSTSPIKQRAVGAYLLACPFKQPTGGVELLFHMQAYVEQQGPENASVVHHQVSLLEK